MEQALFNWVLGIATTALGWFGRIIWEANRELQIDLSRLREELPKEYVRQDSIGRILTRIDARFDRMDDSLEKIREVLREKADK